MFRAYREPRVLGVKIGQLLHFFAFYRRKIWHRTRFQNVFVRRNIPTTVLVAAICVAASSAMASAFPPSGPTVSGSAARLRYGMAAAPEDAPAAVKRAIWAANQLHSKPYRFGGGHASFRDNGYDCSGTVSYALGGAGLIPSPMSSSDFRRYGQRGQGRWITVYARNGHTFAVIGGLRLDTTDFRRGGDVGPRWYNEGRDLRGFQARHPAGM